MQTRQKSKKMLFTEDNTVKFESSQRREDQRSGCGGVSSEENDFGTGLPFDASSWLDVQRKLESIIWIQCDNQHCMKWRKVEKQDVRHLAQSDKWYCKHNKDAKFSSCEVPEEDTKVYDRLAEKAGLKYIKSELSPGALVWAKMDGYCSWPALITTDPASDYGHLAQENGDDVITHYHVEFLGMPHTHGWVFARNVKIFTASTINQHLPSYKEPSSKKPWKRKNTGVNAPTKLKSQYRRGLTVEDGVSEALEMLPTSPRERLKNCIFTEKGEKSHINENDTECAALENKSCSTQTPYTSFNSALANRTKEERLMLDVEMYKKNERAFEHDVSRFMIRNGMKPCKGPLWQNQRITLFQLFLAVHERGGYEQVTRKRQWARIFRELTESPSLKPKNSGMAKAFYHRYLYPYEQFIRGKEYASILHKSASQSSEIKRKSTDQIQISNNETPAAGPAHVVNKVGTPCIRASEVEKKSTEKKEEADDICESESEITSDCLKNMVKNLENSSFSFTGLEDGGWNEENIEITFYDESTPDKKTRLTLADFENPAVSSANMPVQDVLTSDTSDSSQEYLLHQLQTLQQRMELIQN